MRAVFVGGRMIHLRQAVEAEFCVDGVGGVAWRKLGRILLRRAKTQTGRESHAALPGSSGSRYFPHLFQRPRWSESFSIGSVIVDLVVGAFRRSRFCAPALEEFDDCGVSIGSIIACRRYATLYTRAGISLSPCPGKTP